MKKAILSSALCIVLLALPVAGALAQSTANFSADFTYTDFGRTSTSSDGDSVRLLVRGLQATGTIDCAGDTVCEQQGLDGTSLRLQHDFVLEFLAPFGTSRMDFRGRMRVQPRVGRSLGNVLFVSGSADNPTFHCTGGNPSCFVEALLEGTIQRGGQTVGTFNLDIGVRIDAADSNTVITPHPTAVEYAVMLAVIQIRPKTLR